MKLEVHISSSIRKGLVHEYMSGFLCVDGWKSTYVFNEKKFLWLCDCSDFTNATEIFEGARLVLSFNELCNTY